MTFTYSFVIYKEKPKPSKTTIEITSDSMERMIDEALKCGAHLFKKNKEGLVRKTP